MILDLHPRTKISRDLTKNLTQIFLKSFYDPRRRYEAHRQRDAKKISSRVLFEIIMRSQKDFLKIYKKITRRPSGHF